jgi:dTDP-glucose pyrophosphorylase
MKYELVSVVDMWEELKNSDKSNVWNDDNVFESVGMDEFVDDVNEMYEKKEGKSGWFLSDFENVSEFGVNEKNGDYVERELDSE